MAQRDYAVGDLVPLWFNTLDADGEPVAPSSLAVRLLKHTQGAGFDGTAITSGVTLDADADFDFGSGSASQTGLHTVEIDTTGYDPGDYRVVVTAGTSDSVALTKRIVYESEFSVGMYSSEADINALIVADGDDTRSDIAAVQSTASAIESDAQNIQSRLPDNVVFVYHDGNETTSAATLKAAIEGASAGDTVIIGPGRFINVYEDEITVPDDVVVRGSGMDSTVIGFILDATNAGLHLNDNVRVQDLTVDCTTANGWCVGILGTETVIAATLQNVRLLGVDECVEVVSSNASSVTYRNVFFESTGEWGMTLSNAAHRADLLSVFIKGQSPSPTDPTGIRVNDAGLVYGENVTIINSGPGNLGGENDPYAIHATDTATVWLADSSIGRQRLNIEDTAVVRLIKTEFARNLVIGQTGQLDDSFSPLQATTVGRTLDVTANGNAGIDWGNIENAGTTVNLSATTTNLVNTTSTLTGHTPQTGDSFVRLGAPIVGASIAQGISDTFDNTDSTNQTTQSILQDTNELQADWTNNGRLDLILDARASQSSVDTVNTAVGTTIPGILGTPVDTISEDIANVEGGGGTLPLSPTGITNFQTFFNNEDEASTKTINNVTAPKNVTIQVNPQ